MYKPICRVGWPFIVVSGLSLLMIVNKRGGFVGLDWDVKSPAKHSGFCNIRYKCTVYLQASYNRHLKLSHRQNIITELGKFSPQVWVWHIWFKAQCAIYETLILLVTKQKEYIFYTMMTLEMPSVIKKQTSMKDLTAFYELLLG